jgi:phage terminase large subunit
MKVMKKANPNFTYLKKNVPKNRITLLQGGTRSGKTYATIYYIIWLCREYPNAGMEIDLVRNTFAALKATAWKDFKDILVSLDLYNANNHNKTDHIYQLFGNNINYYGADTPDKIHGRSRDILWINEAHQFPEDTIDQLLPRTKHRIICDYNPALPQEHWLDNYIVKYPPLITTYRDNPHLTKAQVEDIENKITNSYWWKVYGNGERAQPTGAIFSNWSIGEFKECDILGFGQDYGFSNDPSTLIKVSIDRKSKTIYLKECFYQVGLNTGQLYELNIQHAQNLLIVADSAEPRLIAELKQRRVNIIETEKGQGSVTAGISLMLEYNIVIDPESTNMIKEFNNYSWIEKTNKSIPMDAYNHCIDAARYFIYSTLRNPNRGKYYIR